jgi:hypothetical protein
MPHLTEVINDVERYSIADVVAAAERSLLPCDCENPDVVELCVAERAEPIRRYCSSCGRDVA